MPQTTSNAQDLQWSVRCDTETKKKKNTFSVTEYLLIHCKHELIEANRTTIITLCCNLFVSMALLTFKYW